MAADRLESDLIGGLLGLIVHDLRNPLSALHSNASFLQSARDASSPDVKEALEDVTASCEALGHIIDNVELLALALRGERRFEQNSFSVRELIADALSRSRSLAASYSVRVEFAPSVDAETKLVANREMLGRALGNLIKNAIQHAQDGAPVKISTRVEGERVLVLVEDGGVPVAPDFHDKAFSAEGQVAAKGLVGARYSRGVGLFAARLAADAAGARVRAVTPPSASGNAFELSVAR
ncbi:MAG TPA: HAMP domain-containing sensor histidine kinase [Polyangiaceae bacterium]|jgi:signal transduction histidine kinase|nr:HAMP domain-containing sensor histidine kinase [Polyangiaceae bacterium]